MNKSKFTESQIVFAIKQAETGTKLYEVSGQMGISSATFFNRKKKYEGLGFSELSIFFQNLSLDKHMLQEVIKKCFEAFF